MLSLMGGIGLQSTTKNTGQELYLELMKKVLVNSIYQDPGFDGPSLNTHRYNQYERENGLIWPMVAHTMIGLKRLENIQFCVEDVLKNQIPGDLVETGVWRGGATIFMRAILKAYDDSARNVWVCDSFCGLPEPNTDEFPADVGMNLYQSKILAVSLETVQENFRRYDLLDSQVHFLKGWFKDTLPGAPITSISVLRLDGDLYESTWQALTSLYPKLSVGGYVIIDDYMIESCQKAVMAYRKLNNITDPIVMIDLSSAYWQRAR
jgi:hypothetical protein